MAERKNHTKVVQLLRKAESNQPQARPPTPTEHNSTAALPEATVSTNIHIWVVNNSPQFPLECPL